MGLEVVEFVLAVEAAFGVEVPDHVTEKIETPRQLADYLENQIGRIDRAQCRSQRAFYALRRAVLAEAGAPRATVRPSTPWSGLDWGARPWELWGRLHGRVGTRVWPLKRSAAVRLAVGTVSIGALVVGVAAGSRVGHPVMYGMA